MKKKVFREKYNTAKEETKTIAKKVEKKATKKGDK